jgi:four helix bundle protein
VTVPANIDEACARRSHADYVRFLDIAFASASEANYLIGLSHQLGFLSDDQERRCREFSLSTVRTLRKLIAALDDNRQSKARRDENPSRGVK